MERGLARLFPLLVPPSQLHSKKVKVKLCSRVWFFVTPWAVACQAPPSMGFSRQEHWSGLPFPSPGIFPTQGLNPGLPPCRLTLYPLSHQASFTSYYPFQKRLKSWPRPGQPLPKGSKVENMAGHKKKKKRNLLKVCDIFGDELSFPEHCQDLTHHLPLTLGVLSSTEDWPDQSSPENVEH